MIRKQIYQAREHSTENLLKKTTSESDQKKLLFNITSHSITQNGRNILHILHNFLMSDQEHKKVFQDTLVVGFRNGESLKDHLFRTKLPKAEITQWSESCLKGNCHICDFLCVMDTFSTKACG